MTTHAIEVASKMNMIDVFQLISADHVDCEIGGGSVATHERAIGITCKITHASCGRFNSPFKNNVVICCVQLK